MILVFRVPRKQLIIPTKCFGALFFTDKLDKIVTL